MTKQLGECGRENVLGSGCWDGYLLQHDLVLFGCCSSDVLSRETVVVSLSADTVCEFLYFW